MATRKYIFRRAMKRKKLDRQLQKYSDTTIILATEQVQIQPEISHRTSSDTMRKSATEQVRYTRKSATYNEKSSHIQRENQPRTS